MSYILYANSLEKSDSASVHPLTMYDINIYSSAEENEGTTAKYSRFLVLLFTSMCLRNMNILILFHELLLTTFFFKHSIAENDNCSVPKKRVFRLWIKHRN